MTKFTATFSNGQTITRTSDRAYAFAWAVIHIADDAIVQSGFSADRANAAKAAASKMWTGAPSSRSNAALHRLHVKMANEKGFASVADLHAHWDRQALEHNSLRRTEIVALR